METSCWCVKTQRQVRIKGEIVGKRQADLLKVLDCEHRDCPDRYAISCLIHKTLEGRW